RVDLRSAPNHLINCTIGTASPEVGTAKRVRPMRLLLLSSALLCAAPVFAGPPERAAGGASRHWSLRPVSRPVIPRFDDPAWADRVRTHVDAFVLDRLTRAGLHPSPEADRPTLVRRLCFDLTGLPPTPEEVAAFVNDPASDAYERLVERLLA